MRISFARCWCIVILFIAQVCAGANEPVVIRSYFSEGFGVLIDVECRILELQPDPNAIGFYKGKYVLFKNGVIPTTENLKTGLFIMPWTKAVAKELEEALKRDPTRTFKLTGFETFRAWGEPKQGKTSRGQLIIGGIGWHIDHYFEVRGVK